MGAGLSKRREPRYHVEIPADLLHADQRVLRSYTKDVSIRGAFILTDELPALRQLFRVRFVLPPNDQPVVLHCMAAHLVEPGGVRAAGVGIQLYGVGGVDGTRWQQFLRWIRSTHPGSLEQLVSFVKNKPAVEAKKLNPAFEGRIKLRFRSVEELRQLYETNLERGGLLLPTRGEVPEGTEIDMSLVHPKASTTFPLHGVVRANVQREGFTGVSVQLTDLTEDRLSTLYDFVYSDISITIDITGSIVPPAAA